MSTASPAADLVDETNLRGLRGRYAGIASRGAAVTIDAVMIVLLFYAGIALASLVVALVRLDQPQFFSISDAGWALAFTAWLFFYGWFSWSFFGQTIGKALLGLRIVAKDGGPMGPGRGLRRCFGWVVALMFFGLGFLWILISKDRRGWHDYIAGTCVIYDWDARVGTLLLARRREEAAGTPSPHR